jgi:hypothetical protein
VEYVGAEAGKHQYASAVIFHKDAPLDYRKDKVFQYFSSDQAALSNIVHHWMKLMARGGLCFQFFAVKDCLKSQGKSDSILTYKRRIYTGLSLLNKSHF